MTNLSVVIPAYNEGHVVKDVILGVLTQLKSLGYGNDNGELILIDDGSTDNTYDKAQEIEEIKIIKHKINRGYGASLKTGIKAARFENIIIFDADGQHDPKYIPLLLEQGENSDMVVALRKGIAHTKITRVPGKLLMRALSTGLAHRKIPDLNSGYRLLKKSITTPFFDLLCDRFSFSTTCTLAMLCSGHNVSYLEVDCKKRKSGESQVTFYAGLRTLLYILQIFMAFKPLRLFFPITSAFLVVGVGSLFHDVVFLQNIGDSTVLLLITAVIFFLIGLVADQIAALRQQMIKINLKISLGNKA